MVFSCPLAGAYPPEQVGFRAVRGKGPARGGRVGLKRYLITKSSIPNAHPKYITQRHLTAGAYGFSELCEERGQHRAEGHKAVELSLGALEKLKWKLENAKVGITLVMSPGIMGALIPGSDGWRQPKGGNQKLLIVIKHYN
jgi:hypothetical protein